VGAALGDLEGGVDLGGVVVGIDIMEGRLVLGLQVLAGGLGEVGGRDGDLEEREHRRKRSNGGDVEVSPAAEVADIPPEVGVLASGNAGDATD